MIGIDVRPADGKLWGLIATGPLVTLDLASGKATLLGAIKNLGGKLVDIAVWK